MVAASAVKAAQRVPRDHVIVVANAFVIGEIDTGDSTNFLYSSNMHRMHVHTRASSCAWHVYTGTSSTTSSGSSTTKDSAKDSWAAREGLYGR